MTLLPSLKTIFRMAFSVLGWAMCNTFTTLGDVSSWGVFQSYYQTGLLKDTPPSNIAWIGSIQYCLVFFPAFVISCGGIVSPTTAVLAHWFKRRRGLATGLIVGSSIGGTIIPIAARSLILQVGFPWTMRIISSVLLVGLTTCKMLVKRPCRKAAGGSSIFAPFAQLPSLSTARQRLSSSSACTRSSRISTSLRYPMAYLKTCRSISWQSSTRQQSRMVVLSPSQLRMGAYQVYHIQLPSDCVQIRVWIVFGPVPVIEFGDTSDVARKLG
ncbi:hypothetical protein CPB85DRAFT_1252479 [Mucidula mucida]|nr:hypothetical protein CPB85DRAFT_1252479 [Mucidula mucida]